ncbi:hypothetical protein GO003_015895 [Methylicorpusculum oleiharenae]|uniref:hypothetical protein n=1 Tax=Methylicorpusculum oleiharenae TaxID=1338687 RepID=UPI001357CE20|nr:hypothetical protein [Methylicorpusculum oleiharenae]MCD2451870.1 hypothetical protein [Methylicorpusculum oleiharenae]
MNTKTVKAKKTEADTAVTKEEKVVKPTTSKAKPVQTQKPVKKTVTATTAETTPEKPGKKNKVVRDSFSFPKSDYRKISELKAKCLTMGLQAKKSEILRAGLLLLETLSDEDLKQAIGQVENLKTGRPLNSAE